MIRCFQVFHVSQVLALMMGFLLSFGLFAQAKEKAKGIFECTESQVEAAEGGKFITRVGFSFVGLYRESTQADISGSEATYKFIMKDRDQDNELPESFDFDIPALSCTWLDANPTIAYCTGDEGKTSVKLSENLFRTLDLEKIETTKGPVFYDVQSAVTSLVYEVVLGPDRGAKKISGEFILTDHTCRRLEE